MAKGKSMALSGDRVRAALLQMDREPFRELLQEFIGARPTPTNIRKWAQENPDRWVQAVGIIARLTGFDFKGTVEHTHRHLHVHMLSDAELEAELEKMRGEVVDAVADVVGAGDDDGAADDDVVLDGHFVEVPDEPVGETRSPSPGDTDDGVNGAASEAGGGRDAGIWR